LLQAQLERADYPRQQSAPARSLVCVAQLCPDITQDWFYVCPAHLKDTGFCTPKIDQAAIEARKKRELEEEIERVKKEYEEKQKKKKDKAGDSTKKDEADDKKNKEDKPSDKVEKTQDKTEPAGGVSKPSASLPAAPSN
jgi:hypothetical protein